MSYSPLSENENSFSSNPDQRNEINKGICINWTNFIIKQIILIFQNIKTHTPKLPN